MEEPVKKSMEMPQQPVKLYLSSCNRGKYGSGLAACSYLHVLPASNAKTISQSISSSSRRIIYIGKAFTKQKSVAMLDVISDLNVVRDGAGSA